MSYWNSSQVSRSQPNSGFSQVPRSQVSFSQAPYYLPSNFSRLPWDTIDTLLEPLTRAQLLEVTYQYPNLMQEYYYRLALAHPLPNFNAEEMANILRAGRVVLGEIKDLQPVSDPVEPVHVRSDGTRSYVLDRSGQVWVDQVLLEGLSNVVEIYPLPDNDIIVSARDYSCVWYRWRENDSTLLSLLLRKVDYWWALTITGELVYIQQLRRSCPSTIPRLIESEGIRDLCWLTLSTEKSEEYQSLALQEADGSINLYSVTFEEETPILQLEERLPFLNIRAMFCAPDLYTLFLLDEMGSVWTYPSDPELELHDHNIVHLSRANELPITLDLTEISVVVAAYDDNSVCHILASCDGQYWNWRKLGRYRDVSIQGSELIALTWDDIPRRKRRSSAYGA